MSNSTYEASVDSLSSRAEVTSIQTQGFDDEYDYDQYLLFHYYAGYYKTVYEYLYVDEGITFLLPRSRQAEFTLWMYRIVSPILLVVGTCGNVLSACVMLSKGMRYL